MCSGYQIQAEGHLASVSSPDAFSPLQLDLTQQLDMSEPDIKVEAGMGQRTSKTGATLAADPA